MAAMTPKEEDVELATLAHRLRRAADAIYIAVPVEVADDLAAMMRDAADRIERLQQSRDYAVRDVVRGAEKLAALRAAYGGKDPE